MQSVSSSSNEEQKVFDTLVETPFTTDMVNNIQPYLNVGGNPNQEIVIEGLIPVTMNELNHDTLSPFDFDGETSSIFNNEEESLFQIPLEENFNFEILPKEEDSVVEDFENPLLHQTPENEKKEDFKETINTLNGVGMDFMLNQIITSKSEDSKKYNKIKEHNEKRIMEIMSKHDLPYESINGILKMNEAYIENLNFHLNLRKAINLFPIKSKVMDILGVRKSYTGFHDYIKGDRPDLPEVGLNSIAKKMGYSIALVPIKNISEDSENIPKDYLLQQDVIAKAQDYFVKDIGKVLEANLKDDLNKRKSKEKPQQEQVKNIMDFMAKDDILDIMKPINFEDTSSMFEDSMFKVDILSELSEEDDFNEDFFENDLDLITDDSEINENQQDSNLTTLNSLDNCNLNSTVPIPVSVPVIKDAFDDFDDSFDENEFQKIEFDKEIKNKK